MSEDREKDIGRVRTWLTAGFMRAFERTAVKFPTSKLDTPIELKAER